MLKKYPDQTFKVLPVVLVSLALLSVSVFSGLVAAVLPWWFIVALSVLPLAAVLVVMLPELGFVFLLLALSGVIPSALLPSLPLGPGRLLATDLIILMIVFLALFRPNAGLGEVAWLWFKPVFWLLVFSALAVVVGGVLFGAPARDVLQEARVQINWLIAPLLLLFISNDKSLRRFSIGIVLVGFVISAAVIFQFATGVQVIENARVENLLTLNTSYADVTRSTAGGGIYFVVFSLLFTLALLFERRISAFIAYPLVLVLAAGVLVSFGRGIWIATACSVLLMAYFLKGMRGVSNACFALSIAVAAALVGLAAFKPHTLEAAYERIVSTTKEGDKNSSLGWRFEETGFALSKISTSPLVGIGYGTPYKPYIRLSNTEQDVALMRYVHNGYLGLWLKLGIAGLCTALWLAWGTFRRGKGITSSTSDSYMKPLSAALTAGFVVPVITSVTQPEWLAPLGVAYFAMTVGLLCAIDRLKRNKVV